MKGAALALLGALVACGRAEAPVTPYAAREGAACDAGDAFRCTQLGVYWARDGNGVEAIPRDYARALARYQQGCDLGSSGACTEAGWLLCKGRGAPRDLERGSALLCRGEELAGRPCGGVTARCPTPP